MRNLYETISCQGDLDHLWQMLRDGDKKGLEGLYRCFSKDLFQHGLSLVPNQDFVQDCIQEVFIDLWKYHKNLQKADNVKIYLLKSLSHKIARESKKEKKWRKEELTEKFESYLLTQSKETELIGIQSEEQLQKRLAKALERLPIRQKEVVVYLFFENLKYEDVAKIMGINLRSVYTLAWKVISNLKKSIIALLLFCTGLENF